MNRRQAWEEFKPFHYEIDLVSTDAEPLFYALAEITQRQVEYVEGLFASANMRHALCRRSFLVKLERLGRPDCYLIASRDTSAFRGWRNADTIPGIKVNTDAVARTTQLVYKKASLRSRNPRVESWHTFQAFSSTRTRCGATSQSI